MLVSIERGGREKKQTVEHFKLLQQQGHYISRRLCDKTRLYKLLFTTKLL